jgi:hypothetical protein
LKDIVVGMQHKSKETTKSEAKISFVNGKILRSFICLIFGGGDEISNNIGFGASYIIQGKTSKYI